MRRFIRHPSSLPIAVRLKTGRIGNLDQSRLRNVSDGGLCFHAIQSVVPGKSIIISIPVAGHEFNTQAIVVWCSSVADGYEVGASFIDEASSYAVRMVEQLCRIEQFRTQVEAEEGRKLSSEQAAEEWIEKFAADFPPIIH